MHVTSYLKTSMNTLESRLNIARTHHLDEIGETVECLKLGRHGVEEGSSKDVHALHVGEAGTRFLCICHAIQPDECKFDHIE